MNATFSIPLLLLSLSCFISADDVNPKAVQIEAKEANKETLLAKGNSWTYAVTLSIPKGVDFKPEGDLVGEKTATDTVYKFTEKQVSSGPVRVDSLDADVPIISIFIDGVLRKKQVLNYVNGQLHYHGTFIENKEDPTKKTGFITIFPIALYHRSAEIGEKWSWTTGKMPKFEFRVVSKKSKIEVLGTTYLADKIRMDEVNKTSNDTLSSKEYWFVEGVGIVKEQEKRFVGSGQAIVKTLELSEFIKASN